MRKLLLIPVLLATTWALAQSDQTAPGQMGKGNASQTSVQGCLSGSSGNYTLTDKTGTTFQLTGSSADLKSHVGQQVQISGSSTPSAAGGTGGTGATGTSGTAGAAAGTGSSSAASQAPQISVESVSKISDTCSPSR